MVYCNLVQYTKDRALYKYGGLYNDITGLLEFDVKNDSYEIISEPQKSKILIRHIQSLYRKHREEFKKGIFKDEISYEIG